MELNEILKVAIKGGASDIHLKSGLPPMFRVDGALVPLIHRGEVSAHSNTLAGVRMNSWDSQLWNASDWSRAK